MLHLLNLWRSIWEHWNSAAVGRHTDGLHCGHDLLPTFWSQWVNTLLWIARLFIAGILYNQTPGCGRLLTWLREHASGLLGCWQIEFHQQRELEYILFCKRRCRNLVRPQDSKRHEASLNTGEGFVEGSLWMWVGKGGYIPMSLPPMEQRLCGLPGGLRAVTWLRIGDASEDHLAGLRTNSWESSGKSWSLSASSLWPLDT